MHARKVKLAPDVDLEKIAALTPGFSGADLANLVNEAALLATRRGAEAVAQADFNEAIERIDRRPGEEEPRAERAASAAWSRTTSSATRWSRWRCPAATRCTRSRSSRAASRALGYTLQRPTEDRFLMTREELENKMAVLLGGRAAEEVMFGHLSTGAANDLAKVTEIARSMVMRYGMVKTLGHVAYEEEPARLPRTDNIPRNREFSEDDRARDRRRGARDRRARPTTRRSASSSASAPPLERWAQKLLEKETLVEAELDELRASLGAPRRAVA